jgi:DNA invertase Pin-like site-specific DNA recombinase
MKIGYARVSTNDQNFDLQMDVLNKAGCERIFTDQGVSGATIEREGLSQAIAAVEKGDVLVVWKLDRLGRSLSFLIELIDKLRKDQAGFESLSDGINTTTAGGKLVFHIMGALAEFERALILERSKAGMQAARK